MWVWRHMSLKTVSQRENNFPKCSWPQGQSPCIRRTKSFKATFCSRQESHRPSCGNLCPQISSIPSTQENAEFQTTMGYIGRTCFRKKIPRGFFLNCCLNSPDNLRSLKYTYEDIFIYIYEKLTRTIQETEASPEQGSRTSGLCVLSL